MQGFSYKSSVNSLGSKAQSWQPLSTLEVSVDIEQAFIPQRDQRTKQSQVHIYILTSPDVSRNSRKHLTFTFYLTEAGGCLWHELTRNWHAFFTVLTKFPTIPRRLCIWELFGNSRYITMRYYILVLSMSLQSILMK